MKMIDVDLECGLLMSRRGYDLTTTLLIAAYSEDANVANVAEHSLWLRLSIFSSNFDVQDHVSWRKFQADKQVWYVLYAR